MTTSILQFELFIITLFISLFIVILVKAYRREIALHVTVKFCTFMEPEKAAKEAANYAEALIKELENEKQ